MNKVTSFEELTPDVVIDSVESALGVVLTGFTLQLPSYINRVYELELSDKSRLIAKFYRPGRWSEVAIRDEHLFVSECVTAEIPVIASMLFPDGDTLALSSTGIFFTLYPKRGGRELELDSDENWLRMGSVLGRLHAVGAARDASSRVTLHPAISTLEDIEYLLSSDLISQYQHHAFREVAFRIMDRLDTIFDDVEYIRIHGDCHRANILERRGEGIMLIDFDDMVMGPPVQDMWLLLPDHAFNAQRELDLIVDGYEQFRDFDCATIALIEPLRAMRIIYFLAWCARQRSDVNFYNHFPDWGSDDFWRKEIGDLERQLNMMIRDDESRFLKSSNSQLSGGRVLTDH